MKSEFRLYIESAFMREVCDDSSLLFDAFAKAYPEQMRWKDINRKLENIFSTLSSMTRNNFIDPNECMRIYINVWKHILEIEQDYFSRYFEVTRMIYESEYSHSYHSILLILRELCLELKDENDSFRNDVSDKINKDLVVDTINQTKNTKELGGDSLGFNLRMTTGQLIKLRKFLIDEEYLEQCSIEDFLGAFSGESLPRNFKKLNWIDEASKVKSKSMVGIFEILSVTGVIDTQTIDVNVFKNSLVNIFKNEFGNINTKYKSYRKTKAPADRIVKIKNFIEGFKL